jgi:TorA maturation chaperone TorD
MNTRTSDGDCRDENRAGLRSDLYALLASLLVAPPDKAHLQRLTQLTVLPGVEPALGRCLYRLKGAAVRSAVDSVQREFTDLFIGMGRGQIVPYASWYGEHLLMAAPLARLRIELPGLNIHRQAGAAEPEDHAGALCEIMVLVIAQQVALAEQAAFFLAHLGPWMIAFFQDLQQARSARFYRAVGRLGEQFMRLEQQLLQDTLEEEVIPS